MKKVILFPTDFAENAPDILHYALELANRFEASILAIHAIRKPNTKIIVQEDRNGVIQQALKKLMDFTAKHRTENYQSIKIEHQIIDEFAGTAILQLAKEEIVNVIVMGMTTRPTILGELFGSVALEVLNKADCPVLAIPAEWEYEWKHKILYATDFGFRDIGVLSELQKMARVFNAVIDCLHVVEEDKNTAIAEINMQLLADVFQSKQMEYFIVKNGELIHRINEYLREENVGLIVMLAKKKKFLERIFGIKRTKEVAQKIKMPLLVFKENAYENQEPEKAFNSFL